MLRSALKPDIVSYNAVISACEKGEELLQAFDVCAAMMRQALEPDVVSYRALPSACETGKEMLGHSTSAWRCCAKL